MPGAIEEAVISPQRDAFKQAVRAYSADLYRFAYRAASRLPGLLGTSEGAIMTRLTRARQALRQQHADSIKRRTAR